MNKKLYKIGYALIVTPLLSFLLASPALAVNNFPLKPDGSNAAPCTVVGSPYGQIECAHMVFTKATVGTAGDATHGLYISSTVPNTSMYETVISSGGAVKLTSTPSISTSTVLGGVTVEIKSGTILVLSSTDSVNTVTFQDGGTLTGSQLQLGAATRAVGQYKVLGLIYDATDHFWREMFYSNN